MNGRVSGEDLRFPLSPSLLGLHVLDGEHVVDHWKIHTGGKKRLRNSFHATMSWAREVGTGVSSRKLPGLPRLIGQPVGVDEKEIKAIVDRWLR